MVGNVIAPGAQEVLSEQQKQPTSQEARAWSFSGEAQIYLEKDGDDPSQILT
jgi:hypothetical protein